MKLATVNTRGWHWVITDAAHQVQTGEILWLMYRGKLDALLLSDVHKANSGGLNMSHKTVALEEFVMIVGKMPSMILSPAAQAAWRETGHERWECKETGRMVAVGLLIAGVRWRFVSVYAPDRVKPAPEPDGRGRQAMGVDIGVDPVSVISNNQRCRDYSLVRCKTVSDQVATSIESGRSSCKTACCTHQRQRQGQGERKRQSTLRQPRPRRRTKQQQEETERRLVGLPRRLVATRHDGVLLNQCYFMPFLDGGAKWRSRGRRGGCSRRQSAALTPIGSLLLQETSRASRGWSVYGLHILQHNRQRTQGFA